jgi:histidinol dehydrogenase
VHSFLRSVHLVEYTEDALRDVAGHIDALGGAEHLLAHVNAVRVRVPRGALAEGDADHGHRRVPRED